MKRIGIFNNKKNPTNTKFFSKKRILQKLKTKIKIEINFNLKNINDYNNIFLLGFVKKVSIKKDKNYYTVHESDLPKGRGMSPMKHQIMNGKNKITACLIKLNDKIDGGDIVFKDKILIKPTDLYDEIKMKQMKTTERLIVKLISNYKNLRFKKQLGVPTYFKKLTDKDDEIDINKSIKKQFNKIRSTNNNHFKNFFYFKKCKYSLNIKKL